MERLPGMQEMACHGNGVPGKFGRREAVGVVKKATGRVSASGGEAAGGPLSGEGMVAG